MGLCVHERISGHDPSIRPDDIADPPRKDRFLVLAGAVREADRPRRVAEKREIEVKLLRERGVGLDGVEADAVDIDTDLVELCLEVAEPAALRRSPGGVGLGVEPEGEGASALIEEPELLARVLTNGELGREISRLEHLGSPSQAGVGQ